jgi:hypothetical protein
LSELSRIGYQKGQGCSSLPLGQWHSGYGKGPAIGGILAAAAGRLAVQSCVIMSPEMWVNLKIIQCYGVKPISNSTVAYIRGMRKNWLRSIMTIGILGYKAGTGAQPQVSGSGARLKKLSIKLATPNSPSTVQTLYIVYTQITRLYILQHPKNLSGRLRKTSKLGPYGMFDKVCLLRSNPANCEF